MYYRRPPPSADSKHVPNALYFLENSADSKHVPNALYFLEKGIAVIKGGPEEPAIFESQDKSDLTRQVVSMACEVRSRDDIHCAVNTCWIKSNLQYICESTSHPQTRHEAALADNHPASSSYKLRHDMLRVHTHVWSFHPVVVRLIPPVRGMCYIFSLLTLDLQPWDMHSARTQRKVYTTEYILRRYTHVSTLLRQWQQ